MELAIEDLKEHSGAIIFRIAQGSDVTITLDGKGYAKIVPISEGGAGEGPGDPGDELFGMWKDRGNWSDVGRSVREMRQGRKL